MRLLPRQGHVHYACARDSHANHEPAVGDKVYVNCEGRLLPVTLVACEHSHYVGRWSDRATRLGEECIEFDGDAIYVVQRAT